MPISALTGSRLRERRLALGLRQADVAAGVGISASYLNLIEHNRRRVGAEVLERLAETLGLPVAALSRGAEAALLDDLRQAAAEASGQDGGGSAGGGSAGGGQAGGAGAELARIEDFAGRFPGWAGVLAGLHRRAGGLARAVEALNDRMSHDPHLSASLHEVLSAVSSVRSTAGILAESEDITPEWRARFHQNLHQDSERLAAGAEALVAYLDGSGQTDVLGIAAPQEELESWLSGRGWHLPEIEAGRVAALEAEIAALASGAARVLARDWVAQAARDAAALPAAAFAAALTETGPDPVLLAARFGCDPLAVFRRIATAPGSQVGLVICDGSGTLIFRKPVPGFAVPRFGAACPLWPLFTALSRPMSLVEVPVDFAGVIGLRFLARAFCQPRFAGGFGGMELREAAMLVLPVGEAAPGAATEAAVGTAGKPVLMGSTCRICPRVGCAARREPSIMSEG